MGSLLVPVLLFVGGCVVVGCQLQQILYNGYRFHWLMALGGLFAVATGMYLLIGS